MPELKQKSDIESQTSPMKETLPQVSVSSTEPLLGNQTRSELVLSLNEAKRPNSDIQTNAIDMMTCDNEDGNISCNNNFTNRRTTCEG